MSLNSLKELSRRLILHDGTILSIQASEMHYSVPKKDIGPYTAAEVHIALGEEAPDSWEQYQDGWYDGEYEGLYYGYVPMNLIEDLIKDRGGIDLGSML